MAMGGQWWLGAALVGLVGIALAQGEATRFDFEQDLAGWSAWYSDKPDPRLEKYAWAADPAVAHGGRQSLRIAATKEYGRAFVSIPLKDTEPGQRYEVGWWVRKSAELDESKFSVRFLSRPPDAKQAGWAMKTTIPTVTVRRKEGEWEYRGGFIRLPADGKPEVQFGLYLNEAIGTIWIDDITIRKVVREENQIADLWTYDPERVELGMAPLNAFRALQAANDPLLDLAKRYNELMVEEAFVEDAVRRLQRIHGYDSQAGRAETQAAALTRAEDRLAALYRAYGEAFVHRGEPARRATFGLLADELAKELAALRSETEARLAEAVRAQRAAGRQWSPPAAPKPRGVPAIAADGTVEHLLFGNRSTYHFQDLERPLRFDAFHSTTTGAPASSGPGQYDWSNYDKEWSDIRASGIPKTSCLLFWAALHDASFAPAWVREKIKQDPHWRHLVQPPVELRDHGDRWQLNWWNPEVRDYLRGVVRDMGRTFRNRQEFLFYLDQWETHGPFVTTVKDGLREVGYGRDAEAAFHRWLADRYGTIAKLNARWGTAYASFEGIGPPADKFVEERRRATPLAAEWELWRQDSFEDWCRLIYSAWKESDPTKPVMAGHSQLLNLFSMPNIYDTCDILSWHNAGASFMPTTLFAHSLSRYNGHKPLAQYENFWGIQEDHDRMFEERPKRAGAARYAFRLTAWDRFVQVWWYSYTSATYLTHYDGNYFDPSYALTTLRYRTAALPVMFEKFRRLEPALLDSRIVASRVAVIAPTASMRNGFPHTASQQEARDLFWTIFPRNHLFEYLPEEYLLDGRARLDDFGVVVLPYAQYLSERQQTELAGWLEKPGRMLLALGPPGLYDELGLDSGTLLKQVFGGPTLTADEPTPTTWGYRLEGSDEPLLEVSRGGSRALLVTTMWRQAKADAKRVERIVAAIEAAAPRPVADDANGLEMVFREAGDRRYLCVLNPNLDDRVTTTVRLRGAWRSVTDLDCDGGYPVPAKVAGQVTSFPLTMAPGEVTILRLEP